MRHRNSTNQLGRKQHHVIRFLLSIVFFNQIFDGTSVRAQSILSTVAQVDQFRLEATDVVRVGNVDVIIGEDPDEEEVAFCHLPALLPLTSIQNSTRSPRADAFEGAAAILLAVEHFNSGNGIVLPQLKGINRKCNIRLTTEIFDTEHSRAHGVDQTIQLLEREAGRERLPCAFLGAFRSDVSIATSTITGLRGYPQFSPISTSSKLDDVTQFPLFGRVVPSDDGTSVGVIKFFQKIGVNNFALLHTNDAYGSAYAASLQRAISMFAPEMNLVSVEIESKIELMEDGDMQRIIHALKDTECRYFFGVIYGLAHYAPVMEEAVRQGIAGTGMHNWIFADAIGAATLASNVYEKHSALYNATKGIGQITPSGGARSLGSFSRALEELRTSEEDRSFLSNKFPNSSIAALQDDPLDFFDSGIPALVTSFLYDTVVAVGLGACAAAKNEHYFDGESHFANIVSNQFEGLTGNIQFYDQTGTRNASSALFSVSFLSENSFVTAGGSSFTQVIAAYIQDGDWVDLMPYIFNDGTSTPPPDLPPPDMTHNYMPKGLRGFCISMGVVIILMSFSFAIWTQTHCQNQVVRASQPIFLHIICIGTLLMGASILPISVDDGIASQRGCDIACQTTPWLLSNGFVIAISALFTKTHRINQIMHQPNFRRVTITPFDVMKPMLVLVGVNILFLSLWTSLSPNVWERVDVDYDEWGRPNETVGLCTISSDAIPFISVLVVVDLGALIYCLYEANLASDISMEFSETEYIMKSMVSLLSVSFIGIPVAIIAKDERLAFIFVSTGLIFVLSLSLLCMIFVPKIRFLRDRKKKLGGSKNPPRIHMFNAETRSSGGSDNAPSMNDDTARSLPAKFEPTASSSSRDASWGSIVYDGRKSRQEMENLVKARIELEEKLAVVEKRNYMLESQRNIWIQSQRNLNCKNQNHQFDTSFSSDPDLSDLSLSARVTRLSLAPVEECNQGGTEKSA